MEVWGLPGLRASFQVGREQRPCPHILMVSELENKMESLLIFYLLHSVYACQYTLNMCLHLYRQAHSWERLVHVQGARNKRSCQPERRAEAKEETVGVFIRRIILWLNPSSSYITSNQNDSIRVEPNTGKGNVILICIWETDYGFCIYCETTPTCSLMVSFIYICRFTLSCSYDDPTNANEVH